MTEQFRKIDRQYVLSDSSVNVYGFRLLTSGYQADEFRKNPIGYYMHRRDEGIALKWEDLRVENDQVIGTPVINLTNSRGGQTCAEAENGFLNAASMGHIVVLEYSNDPALMLPGQTGPTITKWYNKECSLVDIPGNSNALTALYDANENELNLPDLSLKTDIKWLRQDAPGIRRALHLADDAPEADVITGIKALVDNAGRNAAENKMLLADMAQLKSRLADMDTERSRYELQVLLDRALEDKKITVGLRDRLAADYADNIPGLRALLDAMPAYRTIAEHLQLKADPAEAQWQWDDYEKNDPTGKKLKELRANDPARYKELFDKKFIA